MATWDNTTREKYKTQAQLVIGLVLGAVALLPSIVGLVKPPLVFKSGLLWVLGLAAVSVVLLGIVMVLAMIETSWAPIPLIGLGNWIAVVALFVLLTYLVLNLWDDRTSAPTIVSIKVSPMPVEAGKFVELDVEAVDQDGDRLKYSWQFEGRVFSERKNAYLRAPEIVGSYAVTLTVTDDNNASQAVQTVEVAPLKPTEASTQVQSPVVQICNAREIHAKPNPPKPPASGVPNKNKCGA